MKLEGYDFCGWASKNNLLCIDGKVIQHGAFATEDGKRVPLVYNHVHDTVDAILGHAILENRDEGVYAYCSFNNTASGQDAKEAVQHGDVTGISIWANNLDMDRNVVKHGVIREVSLVLAGANPGAFIESVIQHGMSMDPDEEDECILYTGANIDFIAHAAPEPKDKSKKQDQNDSSKPDDGDETIAAIWDTMSEKQKLAVAAIIGDLTMSDDEEGGSDDMKHNVFDPAQDQDTYLAHSVDLEEIVNDAKRIGSMREAVKAYSENHPEIMHSLDTTGMELPSNATAGQTYGFRDPNMLFAEDYHLLNNPPEWISRDMGWVSEVMSGAHHTPFSRIKSMYADITEDEARAKGYMKGNRKKEEVFTLLKRRTDPQTVYKFQKMDRDDILDITSFDVIAWIKAEMRVMLNEEIARAVLIGDGRPADSEDKIKEAHIRPIVKDDPLFNYVAKVSVKAADDNSVVAKEVINTVIRSRKNYKGSGNPVFYTTEDWVTEMLLLEDGIGHKLYKTEAELATALRVRKIVTVEPMEGYTLPVSGVDKPLIGVIVNLADYNIGADKGGEINLFDDFDIRYNQYEYLIETRISGALIKPFSAITVVLDKQGARATEPTA